MIRKYGCSEVFGRAWDNKRSTGTNNSLGWSWFGAFYTIMFDIHTRRTYTTFDVGCGWRTARIHSNSYLPADVVHNVSKGSIVHWSPCISSGNSENLRGSFCILIRFSAVLWIITWTLVALYLIQLKWSHKLFYSLNICAKYVFVAVLQIWSVTSD